MVDYVYQKLVDHSIIMEELPASIADMVKAIVDDGVGETTFSFASSLSAADETTLSNTVTAHPADLSGTELLFYDDLPIDSPFVSLGKKRVPYDFDFTIHFPLNLYKEVTFDSLSAPQTAVYYKNYDGTTYSDPLFKREFSFVRDTNTLALERSENFHAMQRNGSWSASYKPLHKYLTKAERIAEARQRRTKIIDDMKVDTIGLLSITESITEAAAADLGRPFLSLYKPEIIDYIDEANTAFHDAVDVDALYSWLDNDISAYTPDTTIREMIKGRL